MNRRSIRSIPTAAALAVLCAAGGAWAADVTRPDGARAETRAQYQQERAKCMNDPTIQDRQACLKSAGAAYNEIKHNKLHDANTAYRDNALARCKALPAQDQADCQARVGGEGMSSGSVNGGGVIKETVTRTSGTAPATGISTAPSTLPSTAPSATSPSPIPK